MKTCNKCLKHLPLDNFYNSKVSKVDGKHSICKPCKNETAIAWRHKNRDRNNLNMRNYNAKHYYRLRLQRYKITPEIHAQMLLEQKGVCAICNELPKGKRPLAIDHCHETGQVRGLLCYGCNRALHILESKDRLAAAMAYLEKHGKLK